MNNKPFSVNHKLYLKKIKRENNTIIMLRFSILFLGLMLWEALAYFKLIDTFITSCPSKIISTIYDLAIKDNLFYHIKITLFETLLGFIIAGVLLSIRSGSIIFEEYAAEKKSILIDSSISSFV